MGSNQKETTSTTDAGPRTGFLDLPPEIRNAIYHLALNSHSALKIHYFSREKIFRVTLVWNPQHSLPWAVTLSTNLLRICRQVHNEATPILYGSNCFEIHGQDAQVFLRAIGSSKQFLRHIHYSWPYNKLHYKQAVSLLKYATRLQRLDLQRYGRTAQEHVGALRVLMQALHKSSGAAGRSESVVNILHFVPSLSTVDAEELAIEARMTKEVRSELQKLLK
ncbi:hypothetical protein CLAFUW4_13131 [Fulvia fulva]|uniref:DUF7730 domain-containing protein n=1 Tax=Passalora fulva TaxID=5499 RepID=A0A9Q8UV20_PASFU|nr:uncharacterized protein CLAFUR5_12990 [Fulvia fulva]KAK4611569.1 hypothetical protein CLAFUR4_13136 [Fulvia fulva]KAK4612747.1 hypothetical protein CLAFUR0_13140 [Fulvia fulva]UJO23382.1 hypothetical protein CLAFUR5_12990 [Fulvia fulva]WPV21406.1 hypothetical protein CLAFUW4_13131 [Fulvia fulva]WPV36163.1 hypothetical protein CLAFUW7_13139 [Fulvia fulva]